VVCESQQSTSDSDALNNVIYLHTFTHPVGCQAQMREAATRVGGAPNSSNSTVPLVEDLRLNSTVSSRISTVSETAVLIRQPHAEQQDDKLLEQAYSRISFRLMPLFLVVMILNHVDRTNLAYACKQSVKTCNARVLEVLLSASVACCICVGR
jgi:hypothetical protein